MKHLIIFSIIIIGFVLLALSTCYNKIDRAHKYYQTNLLSSNIYTKDSNLGGKYGRGVYANKDFEENEIIELAPYIEDESENFKGIIRDYIFKKSNDKNISVVGFGFASLYNHSDEPNATWSVDEKHIIIKATKPIKKEEEIFISYGPGYWKTRNIEKK